jgi:hypothetical protein
MAPAKVAPPPEAGSGRNRKWTGHVERLLEAARNGMLLAALVKYAMLDADISATARPQYKQVELKIGD